MLSAWVAEQVDARDLKSLGVYPCTSSILVPGTNKFKRLSIVLDNLFFFNFGDCAQNCAHLFFEVFRLAIRGLFQILLIYYVVTVKYCLQFRNRQRID